MPHVLDIIPTAEVLARVDGAVAVGYWHWFFLAQPAPLPEALILGDPDAFFSGGGALGLGGQSPPAAIESYRQALKDPDSVHAMCEDYRAGAPIDREHDEADRGRRRIGCPLPHAVGCPGAPGRVV